MDEPQRAVGLEHWLPLFYERLDTLFDYVGDAPFVLDARAEDVAKSRLAQIADYYAARKSALRHLVETFFDGSAENVVAAILGNEAAKLSDEELDRIAALVESARKEGPR